MVDVNFEVRSYNFEVGCLEISTAILSSSLRCLVGEEKNDNTKIRSYNHIRTSVLCSPYGKLNCIAELQIFLQWVAGFFSGGEGTGA